MKPQRLSSSPFCEKKGLEKTSIPAGSRGGKKMQQLPGKPRQSDSAQRPWIRGINQDSDSNWPPHCAGKLEKVITSQCLRRCFFFRENNTLIQGNTTKGDLTHKWKMRVGLVSFCCMANHSVLTDLQKQPFIIIAHESLRKSRSVQGPLKHRLGTYLPSLSPYPKARSRPLYFLIDLSITSQCKNIEKEKGLWLFLQCTTEEFSKFRRPWNKDSKANGWLCYLGSEGNRGGGD